MKKWIVGSLVLAFGGLVYWAFWTSGHIQVIHTVSYSNAAVFLAIKDNPTRIDRKFVPDPGQHVEALLGSGSRPTISVTPFSNALIAMARNPSLVIIGGSGLNGLSLVSGVGKSLDDLRNRRIGTARGDSLELFAYEAMKPRPYSPVYFTDPFILVTSAISKNIDAATHVEPFATELVTSGLARVLTSKELWGDHPDAVLLTTKSIVANFRSDILWLLRELLRQEKVIKANPERAALRLVDFYNMPSNLLLSILEKQEPRIDIRPFESFLMERQTTLLELKYIDRAMSKDQLFDWSVLQDASAKD